MGRVLRARGNRGELIAEIYSSQPGRAERLKDVYLKKESVSRMATVERVWRHDGRTVLKFVRVDSIGEAERWEGADILVRESERVHPGEGEYSHADLIGCLVLREDSDEKLGLVRGIEEYGGPALLDVEPPGGGELLIPFAKEICRLIDTERKLIRAWVPPGL